MTRKRPKLNRGATFDWTDIDAKILLDIAHRIKRNTIANLGCEMSTTVGTDWPVEVYIPAQKWTASLNI
jgi:hypothetical protein